jgi:glycosyltransferase involved in cell wall biosynthesis
MIERDVPWEKIVVCPQAVDLEDVLNTVQSERESATKTTQITTVARFVEKKGIVHLIHAAELLKDEDIQINIHGYGPLEEDYRKLIEELRLENVALCPPIRTRSEYVRTMKECDLFIAPSIRAHNGDMDGIPTVLMEAMALGVPVAASRVSSIPDLVVDKQTGLLITPGDPVDIARVVRDYLSMSSAGLDQMLDRALNQVRKLSTLDDTMDALTRAWSSHRIAC